MNFNDIDYISDSQEKIFYSLDYNPYNNQLFDKFDKKNTNITNNNTVSIEDIANHLIQNPIDYLIANIIYELYTKKYDKNKLNILVKKKSKAKRKRATRIYATEEQKKDPKYIEKRRKNTASARRSRQNKIKF